MNLKTIPKTFRQMRHYHIIRILATRPKLTIPGILLATIEMLVDAANKVNHKDSVLFSKSYAMCKKFEDHTDFCGLVLKLFGSQEDKISSLISDQIKLKKYQDGSKEKTTVQQNDMLVASGSGYPLLGFGFPSPGFKFPYPGFYPGPGYNIVVSSLLCMEVEKVKEPQAFVLAVKNRVILLLTALM